MTWTTAISDGSCNFGLWLEIVGFGVFGTVKHTPSDTWCNEYSTEGRVYPWLQMDSISGWREEIDFLDATLKVTGLNPRIVDVDGGMTALFKHYRGGAYTRLAAELTSASTTATVDDASEFNSSGLLWIGGECCKYSGKTATTFTGLTRGYLNTEAETHEYDVGVLPPKRPVVGDNVAVLNGRRAYLHFASFSHETGTYSATEIIYRGRAKKGVGVKGGLYTIPVEHISRALNQKVGRGMGSAKLRPQQYVFANYSNNRRLGGLNVNSSSTVLMFDVKVDAGNYNDGLLMAQLKEKMEDALSSYTASTWYPWLDNTGDKPVFKVATTAGVEMELNVHKHDPLWCLGFDNGFFATLGSDGIEHEAESDPRPLLAEGGRDGEFDLETESLREPEKIVAGYAYIPGPQNLLLRVVDTDTTNGTVTVSNTVRFLENLGRSTNGGVHVSADKKDLALREAVRFGGRIDSIIKQMFGIQTKWNTPARYVAKGPLSSDFDFDELVDTLTVRPGFCKYNYHTITKETEIQSLIGPALAIMGACPRITDSGKIGFAAIAAPTAVEANDVLVDDDVWANVDAAMIASAMNATPLVNSITVGINKDFQRKDEAGERITCFSIDALNELGETRQINYDTMIKEGPDARSGDIAERLNELFVSLHFPIFGRESVVVEIPCNWRAKQIKCGDIVRVTHELIYDTPRGTLGVTGAMGLVTGRKVAIAGGHDALRVRIFAGSGWPAIAPTAKATTYNSTSAYLECSSIDLYSATGDTDLTYFNSTAAINVRLWPYNCAGSAGVLATVTSVDEDTMRIHFSSKPLTTAEWTTSGVWMTFADWDNRTADAVDGFAYTADSSAPPSIGTSTSRYHRWGA